jgi:hypothetical protein
VAYESSNEIVNAFNYNLIVGGIFCDLAGAFKCVNHDILSSKLNFYGQLAKLMNGSNHTLGTGIRE